jgi:NADH dehydrogenase/NADH:ubiquinone oxidoreductase subunit G
MTIWWLALILAALGSVGIAFIWLAVRVGGGRRPGQKSQVDSLEDAAREDVEHVFNEEFREELRNRGRLHFEKIIGENAMFLQQDLRLTTSQLNEYMKTEITRKLQEEFNKYEQSIMDAKQLAIESIQKTNAAIDEQREVMGAQVQQEIEHEKKQIIDRFEQNMTDIVNHYVLAAVGNQIDLNDQLEYILTDLEANKAAILEDIQSGA